MNWLRAINKTTKTKFCVLSCLQHFAQTWNFTSLEAFLTLPFTVNWFTEWLQVFHISMSSSVKYTTQFDAIWMPSDVITCIVVQCNLIWRDVTWGYLLQQFSTNYKCGVFNMFWTQNVYNPSGCNVLSIAHAAISCGKRVN